MQQAARYALPFLLAVFVGTGAVGLYFLSQNNEALAGALAKTGGLASLIFTVLIAFEVLHAKMHWSVKLIWLFLLLVLQIVAALGFYFFEKKEDRTLRPEKAMGAQ